MEPDADNRLVAWLITVLSYLAIFVGAVALWYVLYTWIWGWVNATY